MSISDRSMREQAITDQGEVYEQWDKLRRRFAHIFESPNTQRVYRLFDNLLKQAVPGKRVLEIGCAGGWYTERLSSFGASYVLGTELSPVKVAYAKQRGLPGVEFAVYDASLPCEGPFDVIVGMAVLHHLDYQEVLQRFYRDNLNEHGLLLFYEPLGDNWLIRLFHLLSKRAHTPDERPFSRRDVAWMRKTFPRFTMIPVNYLSLPPAQCPRSCSSELIMPCCGLQTALTRS